MKRKNTPVIKRPVIWVTGASRGIGKETAKQFASIGCIVCLSSRNKRDLNKTAREIESLGGQAYVFPMDVKKFRNIPVVHRKIRKNVGPVDVLVNNAGSTLFGTFLDTPGPVVHEIIETNLIGPLLLIKEVLPYMAQKKSGWIFNIISMVALKTYEGSSVYTASKTGMRGFGKVLREEMRSNGVRVVNVVPGATETDMWHHKVREKYSGRMMKAKSIAEAVLAAYQMPDDVVVDEIVLRPLLGDLN